MRRRCKASNSQVCGYTRRIDYQKPSQNNTLTNVVLALPTLRLAQQTQIKKRIEKLVIDVQIVPSFSQLLSIDTAADVLERGRTNLLLNRDKVGASDHNLITGV